LALAPWLLALGRREDATLNKLSDFQLLVVLTAFVVFCFMCLALLIAFGNVEERHSFGLTEIIGCLATLAGGISTLLVRAFTYRSKHEGNHTINGG
jgi:uncharacterized membrane-anchored protein